jgi:hypothetical protein
MKSCLGPEKHLENSVPVAAASVAAAQAAAPTGWHAPRDVAAAAGGASVVAWLRSGDLEMAPI